MYIAVINLFYYQLKDFIEINCRVHTRTARKVSQTRARIFVWFLSEYGNKM